jgi:hypothetical protein
MTLDEIVIDFIRNVRARAAAEMRFHKRQPDLATAIHNAVWPGGGKHGHQYRLRPEVLNQAEDRLQAAAASIALAPDFHAVHCLVESKVGSIHGIGELAVYDIAHRVGAFLGKTPALVYLHCGTKAGAAILGFRGKTIDPKELPTAFSRLTAAEIEDCLCIYKRQLDSADLRTRLMQRRSHCFSAKLRHPQKC